MAADSPRDAAAGSKLPRSSVDALHAELLLWSRHPENEAVLVAALDRIAEEAHRSGMRIEELLIFLKHTWQQIPHGPGSSPEDRSAQLTRMVTRCIREYYRTE